LKIDLLNTEPAQPSMPHDLTVLPHDLLLAHHRRQNEYDTVDFYEKFGFEGCVMPVCPFDNNNEHFLTIRNNTSHQYIVGYEPEFEIGA